MLSSGIKCYHLELMLSLPSGAHIIIWDEMLSSGANVIIIIWSTYYHLGRNVIIWSLCYHLGRNIIMRKQMLSSGQFCAVYFPQKI